MRVLDLGAGGNPDPRASETVDLYTDADHQFDLTGEWPIEDGSVHGLIATHVIEHLPDPQHFFQEAQRVLTPDGWLELTYPIGTDAYTDPTHHQHWTPATAERFSDPNSKPWNPQTGFHLTNHQVEVWYYGPTHRLSPLINAAARLWPTWAANRADAGEVTARYTPTGGDADGE